MKSILTLIAFIVLVMSNSTVLAQNNPATSILEIYTLSDQTRTVVLKEDAHFEAPNWTPDGDFLLINQEGLLYKVSIANGSKTLLPTGSADRCNNDHGISPDGSMLAISNNDRIENATGGTSRIYVLPALGGEPRLVTEKYPSYWHGWAPDNKSVVYTAEREDNFDIYRISIEGGMEERLTADFGLDDGPEYSHDGKHIYYNSMKSGSMEIWKMLTDGSNKEQITDDKYSNWFAHPDPTGQYVVFISYHQDQGDRHPGMKEVSLRLLDLQTNEIKILASFTGGQGSINVPSWSPDGSQFAFVSYK